MGDEMMPCQSWHGIISSPNNKIVCNRYDQDSLDVVNINKHRIHKTITFTTRPQISNQRYPDCNVICFVFGSKNESYKSPLFRTEISQCFRFPTKQYHLYTSEPRQFLLPLQYCRCYTTQSIIYQKCCFQLWNPHSILGLEIF